LYDKNNRIRLMIGQSISLGAQIFPTNVKKCRYGDSHDHDYTNKERIHKICTECPRKYCFAQQIRSRRLADHSFKLHSFTSKHERISLCISESERLCAITDPDCSKRAILCFSVFFEIIQNCLPPGALYVFGDSFSGSNTSEISTPVE
jgi:hypothetical protein